MKAPLYSIVIALAISFTSGSAVPVFDNSLLDERAVSDVDLSKRVAIPVADHGILDEREALPDADLDKRGPQFCSFQAFTGDHCDGAAGSVIQVEKGSAVGDCIGTQGRHSFRLSNGGAAIAFNAQGNCYGSNTSPFNSGCYNVNTGQNWANSQVYC